MEPVPRNLKILSGITIALFVIALYMVFIYAPREAIMGDVQRVFYFHVAAGWVGFLAFLVTAIAGGVYLAKRDRNWDRAAEASAEIGVVFIFINIVSGSIWARPIWNTWWTWDPRLVTATIMLLLYVAYLMLRQGIDDPDRRARFGSVYGIVAFVSVPITFFSIRIWRTIHPVVIGSGNPSGEGAFDMTPPMVQAFMFSLLTFTFIYMTLMWYRVRLRRLSEQVEERKMEMMSV